MRRARVTKHEFAQSNECEHLMAALTSEEPKLSDVLEGTL